MNELIKVNINENQEPVISFTFQYGYSKTVAQGLLEHPQNSGT